MLYDCLYFHTVLRPYNCCCHYPAGYRVLAYLNIVTTRYKVGQLYHPTKIAFCYLGQSKSSYGIFQLTSDRRMTIKLQSERLRQAHATLISYTISHNCCLETAADIRQLCSRVVSVSILFSKLRYLELDARMAEHIDQDVPGTVLLVDLSGQKSDSKHASDRSDIVLVPQPSKDPEDPLNWSRKRKLWSLAMVFVYTMGVGIPGTLHYSVIADISKDTGIPTVDIGEHVVDPSMYTR